MKISNLDIWVSSHLHRTHMDIPMAVYINKYEWLDWRFQQLQRKNPTNIAEEMTTICSIVDILKLKRNISLVRRFWMNQSHYNKRSGVVSNKSKELPCQQFLSNIAAICLLWLWSIWSVSSPELNIVIKQIYDFTPWSQTDR